MNIKTIREYMENINLDDYELGGVELVEEDFESVLETMKNDNKNLEDVVHEYLIGIREILDMELDDDDDWED